MKRLLLPSFLVALLFAFASPLLAQTHFVAFLEGSEEQDATFAVSPHGYAHITLSEDRSQITYMVNVWKTTTNDPMGHFHTGPRKYNGPIRKNLTFDSGVVATGVWRSSDIDEPLTQDIIDSLLAGKLYVNAHTLNNPGGELRGQFFQPESYWAFATAQQEVPDPGKDTLVGGAAALFVRDPINNILYYRATANALSSPATMAHIHKGAIGEAGPPVKNTNIDSSTITTSGYWTPDDQSQPFTAEQYEALRNGQLYWNIHTKLHGPGELRGQIGKPEGYLFTALLSGPSEAIGSGGEGTAILLLSPQLDRLYTVAATAGLSGPILDGHIHVGRPPMDGPPVVNTPRTPFGLIHEWTSTDQDRPLTRADVDSLFAGAYYINLHTAKFPAGELRGQIIPLDQEPGQARTEFVVRTGEIAVSASRNPVREMTNINYELPYPMRVELTLIDVTGKAVWQEVQSGDKGRNVCPLSARELAAGTYVLQVLAGGESASMNLVVTK
ncbi:MAG TPA: CHRD domain-containing protein [Candidatus Kapabacteria bacterium]|nr:CHRD domain-containing protein [Candidatus Kapabacteria bacterium]